MSLLMNEEFAIYQLRSGYLNNFKDGVGERLITLNSEVFNQPAFRAAGWAPDPSEIKRTYSPPIPTAVTSEYFQAPPRSIATPGQDEDEEGTLLTGHGSNDTIGPTLHARRRRRKEHQEEDDSSELSDDSEEEEEKRDAQKIRFNKMPVRIRSGSSPARPSKLKDEVNEDDVKVMVTSPSRPPETGGIRRGSLSAVDTIKQRARRDTATSSEMSSENEDSMVFRRRKLERRTTAQSMLLPDIIQEEDAKRVDSDLEDEDISEASDMSDMDDVADADILLNIGAPLANVDTLDSSPPHPPALIPAAIPASGSPRKRRELPADLPRLPRLPSGRPVSMMQSVSLLSKALKSNAQADDDPTAQFAQLSGKGETNPLWIKVLYPGSSDPDSHLEIPTRKSKENGPLTVAEFIGLCLWRYNEDAKDPPIAGEDLNVNKWVLYMVDFGEVEYDFPPLARTRPITDFTTNNNKPGRLRPGQKPWDEFAIVKANEKQLADNEKATPDFAATSTPRAGSVAQPERSRSDTPTLAVRTNSDAPVSSFTLNRNPITGPSFALNSMVRKDSTIPLLDAPVSTAGTSRHRTGVSKQLQVHFTDQDTFQSHILKIDTTTDAYIAEIFTEACDALKLPNKALYVLKVRGTSTVVPEDRTVEALGDNASLDLQRRRFIGVEHREGAASPSSESPNAPLLLAGTIPTKKGKKGLLSSTARPAYDVGAIGFHQLGPGGKRYHVLRRQQLSFAPSHPKVIALDGEYIHIMPGGNMDLEGQTAPSSSTGGKTTSVHLRDVIGCKVARKHPKLVRVLVYREKETKRYEFEAESRAMAAEIVEEIRKGVERFGGGD
ncbi:Target of rapamycin complex 2 subunit sin1-like protein [Elsinoe fawcettii]|nr:Target of rapamycin complex 2 subunit sin1-like protein [Elsinoe fawcettii]